MTLAGTLQGLRIVAFCVVAAIAYGICHDMVTAHICVEYFTIGHPKIIEGESPIAMALLWGVLATWWFGLALGIPLALVSRLGSLPVFTVRDLVAPVATVLFWIAVTALLFGFLGWLAGDLGWISVWGPIKQRLPEHRRVAFIIDRTAHQGAYGAGAIGAVALWFWVWGERARRVVVPVSDPE